MRRLPLLLKAFRRCYLCRWAGLSPLIIYWGAESRPVAVLREGGRDKLSRWKKRWELTARSAVAT